MLTKNMYLRGDSEGGSFSYKVLMEIGEVQALAEKLQDSEETIAVDTETTGTELP